MGRRVVEGLCRLCGEHGRLSFEHVPPRSAFNDSSVILSTIEEWTQSQDDGRHRGKVQQRGIGSYSLCERCNNQTGSWYASEYVRWAKSAVPLLAKLPQPCPLGVISFRGCYPSRLLKQAVAMFLAICGESQALKQEELRAFVLDRNRRHLPGRFEVFMRLYRGPVVRSVPFAVEFSAGLGRSVSEVAFPPFAFLMTYDEPPLIATGRISHFGEFGFNQVADVDVPVALGEGHTPFPNDYRTKAEVEATRRENEEWVRQNPRAKS